MIEIYSSHDQTVNSEDYTILYLMFFICCTLDILEQKMPGNVCKPSKVPQIDACPTGYGNSVQEVMHAQKTVPSCSQLLSSHSETNRHTSGEGENVLFSV